MIKTLDKKEAILDLVQKKRVLYVDEKITPDMEKDFGLAIMWLNAQSDEEIPLIINCNGGSATAGLNIYDMVRFSNAPVTGIVFGRANSMASVILQGCKKRYALPHAKMWIHYLRTYEIPLNEIEEDLEKAIRLAREEQESINEIYREATHRSLEDIKSALKADKSMSAKEALEFGLIDEIITNYKI